MRAAAVLAVVCVALAAPASALAHANLLATHPADGARLAHAPRAIVVRFDDTVRVGSGNAVVENATGRSVLAGPPRTEGRTLTLPLEPGLGDADYSVRWSIVSDDGHLERGVLAFAVGASTPPPHSILGATVPLTWSDLILRTLYYLGLLTAGGAAVFGLLVRRLLGPGLRRPLAQLLFFALLAVFVGGSGIVHTAAPGTRYVHVVEAALGLSLAGGASAALAPAAPRLLAVAGSAGLALLAAPTLAGHALDPNQRHALSVPADLLHVAAAGTWLGGLLGLAYVVPRATQLEEVRLAVARRFSAAALAVVPLLAASGLARALTELSAVSQVWSTSYGRALAVKSALFAGLLALGFVNRRLLRSAFRRLRRPLRAEALVLAAVVVAVSVLTELRPGRDRPAPGAAPPGYVAPAGGSPSR